MASLKFFIGLLMNSFQAMQKAGVNVFPAVDAEKYVSINSKVFLLLFSTPSQVVLQSMFM